MSLRGGDGRVKTEKYYDCVVDFDETEPGDSEAQIAPEALELIRILLGEIYSGADPEEETRFNPETVEQLKKLGNR